MNHAAGVLAVNDFVVFWIESFQLLNECFESLFLQPSFHHLARLVVDGGDVVDTVANGIDIHHAAT